MKKLFRLLPIVLLSLYFSNVSFGQGQDDDDKKTVSKALETISKYTASQSNLVDDDLGRMGFKLPPNISQKQWSKYPTIRKIELAYAAAENASANGGQKMLALLSQSLAQQYESADKDPVLQRFRNNGVPSKIPFLHPPTFPALSNLSNEIKQAISLIAKYADNDAIGGLNSILINDFEIDESEAYELQRNSNSTEDALKKGISKYDDAKVQKSKITNVVNKLADSYESTRYEKAFEPFRNSGPSTGPSNKGGDFGFEQVHRPPPSPIGPSSGGPNGKGFGNTFDSQKQYSKFVKKSYSNPMSRSFSNMKISRGGFGGVIFGSPVQKNPKLPVLDSVSWIPDIPQGEIERGTLEFKYRTGEKKYVRDILLEDLYASYNILYAMQDSLANYVEGDGIGLASIAYSSETYLDYNKRAKRQVLLHPAVANLSIGWSLLYSDIAPIIKENIAAKIKNNPHDSIQVYKVFSRFGDWKVTDVPVTVSFEENELSIKRTGIDEGGKSEIYFSMTKISGGFFDWEDDIDSITFDEISPILCKYDYNYKRVNDFAKIFLTLRYAKMEKAKMFALPDYSRYSIEPHFITFDNGRVLFETPLEEGNQWRRKINEQTSEFARLLDTKNELKGLSDSLITSLATANKQRDELWHQINNYYYLGGGIEPFCSHFEELYNLLKFNYEHFREKVQQRMENDSLVRLNAQSDSLETEIRSVNSILRNKERIFKEQCPGMLSQYIKIKKELDRLGYYSSEYQVKVEEEKTLLNTCAYYANLAKKKESLQDLSIAVHNKIVRESSIISVSPPFLHTAQREREALWYILNNICN